MKPLLLVATILIATTFTHRPADTLSAEERKMAVDYFQKTKGRFLNDVKGLSEQQLNFKADTAHWSIAQCVEHISLAESLIWQWEQMLLKQPAAPEKRSQLKFTNEQLLKAMLDRSKKFKAPEMLQPVGKFPSTEAAIKAFVNRRDSTIEYLKTTQDDLHNHVTEHPAFGLIDGYQVLLSLAGHSERHTLQIEEVKASPAFPKN